MACTVHLGVALVGCSAPIGSQAQDTEQGSGTATAMDESGSTMGSGEGASATPGNSPDDATAATEDDGAATAGGGGSGGGSGAGTGALGICVAPCREAADCCPFGALGCPGESYPNDWSCVDGACTFGGCQSDDDCDGLLGLGPEECHPVAGVPTCVAPCDGGGCGLGTQCIGQADDGSAFCAAPADGPCDSDDSCEGAGVCDTSTGRCGCASDAECEPAALVCALP